MGTHDQQQLDLRNLAIAYAPNHRQSGASIRIDAFWRGDDSRDFAVYEHGYKDWKTGQGGSTATGLLMTMLGVSYEEARVMLGKEGYTANATHRTPPPAISEPPSAAWQAIASAAVQDSSAYLFSGNRDAQSALAYLQGRGLTLDTIRAAKLGYNPTKRALKYTHEGTPLELPRGIIIPHFQQGTLWGVKIRFIGQALKFRYGSLTGSKSGSIYNSDAITPGQPVIMVEGEIDALIVTQATRIAAVTLGSASNVKETLTTRQRDLFASASRVYLMLDNDEPGRSAQQRLTAIFGPKAQIVPDSGHKDANAAFLAGVDLSALIASAAQPIEQVQASHEGDELPYMPPLDYDALYADVPADIGQPDELPYMPEVETVGTVLKIVTQPSAASARYWFNGDLPDTWISALNRCGDVNVAAVFLLFRHAHATQSRIIVQRDLMERNLSGHGLSETATRDFLRFANEAQFLTPYTEDDSLQGVKNCGKSFQLASLAQWRTWIERKLDEKYPESAGHNPETHPALEYTAQRLADIEGSQAPAVADELNRVERASMTDDQRTRARKYNNKLKWDANTVKRSLSDERATPLPADMPINNTAALIRALAAATLRDGMTHKDIAQLTGNSSKGGVKAVAKAVGMVGEYKPIVQEIRSEKEARILAKDKGAWIQRFHVDYEPGQRTPNLARDALGIDRNTDHWIQQHRASGGHVTVVLSPPTIYRKVETVAQVAASAPRVKADAQKSAARSPKIGAIAERALRGYVPDDTEQTFIYRCLKATMRRVHKSLYRWQGSQLVNTSTGEVYTEPAPETLIDLILSRQVIRQPESDVPAFSDDDMAILRTANELGAMVTECNLRKSRTS